VEQIPVSSQIANCVLVLQYGSVDRGRIPFEIAYIVLDFPWFSTTTIYS